MCREAEREPRLVEMRVRQSRSGWILNWDVVSRMSLEGGVSVWVSVGESVRVWCALDGVFVEEDHVCVCDLVGARSQVAICFSSLVLPN